MIARIPRYWSARTSSSVSVFRPASDSMSMVAVTRPRAIRADRSSFTRLSNPAKSREIRI
jgi:hypothetical protein